MKDTLRPVEREALALLEGSLLEAAAEVWRYCTGTDGYIIRAELAMNLWPLLAPHFAIPSDAGEMVRWAVQRQQARLRLPVLAEAVRRSVAIGDAAARQRREAN